MEKYHEEFRNLENLTLQELEDFHNQGIGSRVIIPIPGQSFSERKIILDFSEVIKSSINPRETESILIFGESLYKHYQNPKFFEETKKKYWLFGPKTVEVIEDYDVPKIMDLMVLTNKRGEEFKILNPKNPEIRSATFINWSDIPHDTLERLFNVTMDIGACYHHYFNGIPLRINYCPTNAFIDQSSKGKEFYKNIAEWGVPIIGQEKFKEIMGQVQNIERSPLHNFKWNLNERYFKGKLRSSVIRGKLN